MGCLGAPLSAVTNSGKVFLPTVVLYIFHWFIFCGIVDIDESYNLINRVVDR